jgi:hypothetical protein
MPNDNSLFGLRAVGDPRADEIFHEAATQTGFTAMQALAALRKPATELPKQINELLDSWVRHGPELPEWADPKLIQAGQRFFNDWDLAICTSLFNASLPSAYAGAQGARVLSPVSQLAERKTVALRIGETGQLLLDITQPGAMERGGAGYRHVIQVRELHAAVRAVLLGKDAPGGAWPEADGVPINQEDLLATLLTFTVVVLRALDRMGIEVSPEEQEAYLHLWAVTGDLLGIAEAKRLCEPQNMDRLTTYLQESLQRPSADGVFLMAVLLDEMEFAMPLGLRRVPRTMVRFLVGDRVADMLDVPRSAWWSPALTAAAGLNRRLNRFSAGRRINVFPSRVVGRQLIQQWIDQQHRGEGPSISITAEQSRRWHLTERDNFVAAIRRQRRAQRRRLREPHARVPRSDSPTPAR